MDETPQKPNRGLNKSELVSIAFELGFIIALPVLAFGYLGKWLDGKLGSYPTLTLIGIFAAIAMTSFWIYRRFKSFMKR